ncbi:MAG TPA: TetR/AcrR family transcriptional regulator [Edaphobacter sp.]|nr:TetR/AcrR family transcriptional regulator [Edaphobacter sp.]
MSVTKTPRSGTTTSRAKTADARKKQVVTEFRRSEILLAATKVFGAKGYDGTRMDDIAEAAGMAKATVYVYFRSKDEIYVQVVEQALAELAALTEQHIAAAKDFAGRLGAFISVRLSYWREKQTLYRVITSLGREISSRKRSLKWQKQTVDYLVSLFSAAAESGEIERQDFEASAWALMDMIRGISDRRIVQYERSSEEEVRFLTEFILKALGCRRAAGS